MKPKNSRFARWSRVVGVSLLALGASVAAHAQNAIESVTSSMQSGGEVIRVDLTQPLAAVPTGFAIQTPARIALDFPGVTNAIGRSAIDVNQGNLRSINVVQAGERTRLVLNLKQATAYKAEIQGKSILVSLEPVPGAALVASTPQAFAENRNRDTLPLRDVDFRLGSDNTGRVVVDLANNQVGVDIRQQGRSLVVEFTKSTLPEGLRRRLDVSDFGTPVQTVTTQQAGDRVRMTIEPKGDWEHSAYQSENQFVVEVRPRKVDPTKLTQGVGYTGEKLSLNFQNIEIRSLLQVIADFTNFNIVTSDSVTGALTLRLKDVPWDQALDIIMQAKNLGMRKNGSVLWIAPKDEINAKEKLEFEAQAAIQNLEPLRTQSFQLNYTKAVAIAQGLTGTGASAGGGSGTTTRILSPRGSVIAESRTNQLFVSDIPSRLQQVAELIQKLDIPVRQVLIEARIVEASDTFGKSLGVRLGGGISGGTVGSNNGRPVFGNIGAFPVVTPATATAQGSALTTFTNSNFVNLPSTGVAGNGNAPGTFAISLFNSSFSRMLNLEISALEADGKGKVVSSPRVVTADQTKALIEQGTELPYQVATSSGATSIAFRKANLKLEVTPQITPEGNIILTLDVNKDTVGQATTAGFAINTKHVQTEVLVENGGTVVIGGIFELTETNDESRVPVLGEVPYVGALFRKRERVANKTEMLVFITPKMITDRNAAR
ncbi:MULTISPECIES: type IV pilus secretin family protein [unclassified Variovorax]|uniref:type IV pilus secretin family protein n=1 Tax=unclassified Variovorax TaxID=663243 RepID=UPI00076DB87F|nr:MULTISPECIES: type IV pilus secretin family protein [unclassified Variovorax]KWT97403.1 Type IV pilus biogenesis protein PilQ [Variovorax sp. WDL1]PNG60074.1 Type IV pilus biogenesis and competence protein PilQ [Variovorax sp. B4]PNG60133.1 Type IV pilus biogenesis and competence protein PilQ [Variovorax sp. B2]VTV14051.1 Type IV pilus biogenesis and competence protein PilQ precursor [Variovorax sp. WDL1]